MPKKKKESLTELLIGQLESTMGDKTAREKLSEKLIEIALAGDKVALQYIFDRVDGKPKEKVEIGIFEHYPKDDGFFKKYEKQEEKQEEKVN